MESNSDPAIIVNLHHVTCGKLAMMTSFRFREVHALTLKSVVNKRTLFHFYSPHRLYTGNTFYYTPVTDKSPAPYK